MIGLIVGGVLAIAAWTSRRWHYEVPAYSPVKTRRRRNKQLVISGVLASGAVVALVLGVAAVTR